MNYAYQAIADSMSQGAPLELICATCRWDVSCVQPPEMTTDQVEKKIEEFVSANGAPAGIAEKLKDPRVALSIRLTAVTMFGDRDVLGRLCPVLAARIRTDDGRQIVDALKTTMRSFSGT